MLAVIVKVKSHVDARQLHFHQLTLHVFLDEVPVLKLREHIGNPSLQLHDLVGHIIVAEQAVHAVILEMFRDLVAHPLLCAQECNIFGTEAKGTKHYGAVGFVLPVAHSLNQTPGIVLEAVRGQQPEATASICKLQHRLPTY